MKRTVVKDKGRILLLLFNVTPFKIGQNEKQKCLESEKRKKVAMQRLSPRFRSSDFSYARYVEKLFPQIYRDFYRDATLVPMRMGTKMAAGN